MEHSRSKFHSVKVSVALLIGATLCAWPGSKAHGRPDAAAFTLTSPDFKDGGTLPAEFTCDGNRVSPPLQWSNAPEGTESFAITMHHIPGPGDKHVYLVIYNIPADVHAIAKNSKDVGSFGINTVNGQPEYTPPCSKGPGPKKYTMTVYALSAAPKLDQPAGLITMDGLLVAIKDTTLAKAEMSVTYSRPADHVPQGGGPDKPAGPDQPDRPRRGGPEQHALDQLQLTADEKAKVDPIIEDFREKQQKLREELLARLKGVLDEKQYQQFEASFPHPPAPPPQDQGGNNPPPP